MSGTRKTEYPILFSHELIPPIRRDRKTQTRRVVRGVALEWLAPDLFIPEVVADPDNILSPYGYPGDFLYVREAHWQYGSWRFCTDPKTGKDGRTFVRFYPDDNPDRLLGFKFGCCRPQVQFSFSSNVEWLFRPSIFLPKWASRIWLENTGTRIERLGDMIDADAIREGVYDMGRSDAEGNRFEYRGEIGPAPLALFLEAWDDLNGKRGHGVATDPWVWVVDFKRTEARRAAA